MLSHTDRNHSLYYEDQKEESLRRSKDYIANRLPKFLGYFQRVLKGKASGDGPWLYAGRLTYADLVLFHVCVPLCVVGLVEIIVHPRLLTPFQCVDGLKYMFPNAVRKLEGSGDYDLVFALHGAVQERPRIKAYLASDRRQKYSMGLYRQYPELDPVE